MAVIFRFSHKMLKYSYSFCECSTPSVSGKQQQQKKGRKKMQIRNDQLNPSPRIFTGKEKDTPKGLEQGNCPLIMDR